MSIIKVGNVAPMFTVKNTNNKSLSLSDFNEKKVLLSWHPLAWTPVSTDQIFRKWLCLRMLLILKIINGSLLKKGPLCRIL
ncbi:redoxin domain-containing protein [Serpentinicella alkaliphila]|uniref:AhpC/TSA family protein n=1 Tax=Serpentinicella alkaliphila TaxID=1734049 RepID=A0A4R2TAV6_9FIRM|nr:redoxin domain-containing protein [Serpentinicella alkaliphila]QUH25738.1 redoxin domain-containing protein [Serpentinicella alkaliphila]TCP99011.1 AhpC/TSA family protein [Serpentinicella alkaliphila]